MVSQAPMISTRQTAVSTTVTREDMDMLPLGRGYMTVINMTPGILSESQGGGVTGGSRALLRPRHRGAKNSWAVDGASTDGRFYPGETGTTISKNQLEETQVSVSSHDIMNIAGGVSVNFVSKRGGNRVSGNVFIELMDKKFERNQTLPDYMKSLRVGPGRRRTHLGLRGQPGRPHLEGPSLVLRLGLDLRTRRPVPIPMRSRGPLHGQLLLQDQRPVQEHHRPVLLQLVRRRQRVHAHLQLLHRDAKNPEPIYVLHRGNPARAGQLLVTGKIDFFQDGLLAPRRRRAAGGPGPPRRGPPYSLPQQGLDLQLRPVAPKSALPPISMMLAQDEIGRQALLRRLRRLLRRETPRRRPRVQGGH